MYLKELDYEEIVNIYNNNMKLDFPAEELKPIDSIRKLINKKIYLCYGLYNNQELLAYAFLVTSGSYLLFDYYAVCSQCRNKGIGSKFFNMLYENCKNYNGIILEVEKVECATSENEKLIRQRRINFYNRNGMTMTNVSSKLFNVNFSIMCLCNVKADDSVILEELVEIYKKIFPSELYSNHVKVSYNLNH